MSTYKTVSKLSKQSPEAANKKLLSSNKRSNTINKKLQLKLKASEEENDRLRIDLLFLKNEVSLLKQSGGKLENKRRMRPPNIKDYYNFAITLSRINNIKFYAACKILYKESPDQINKLILKNSKSKNRLNPEFDDFYQNARTYKKRNLSLNIK